MRAISSLVLRGAAITIGVASALGLVAAPSPAFANGRFPESNQVVFSPNDPDLILLRATFGLLVSHDRGKTFNWICELSIGYSGVEDPMYTVTPSQAYVGTTFQGVSITRDQGCQWSFAGGGLEQKVFIDLSANPQDTKNILFFASSYDRRNDAGASEFLNQIWETKDEAQNFVELTVGKPLDATLLGYTIDFSPSDPNRIYISAVRNPGVTGATGVLLVSKDHGQNWSEEPIPLENEERSVFIAAVDPNNAERVYLRTFSGGVEKPSRLLVRERLDVDGGGPATLRVVKTAKGSLSGFALSADGTRVYAGGPFDGISVASTSDFAFRQTNTRGVQCLTLGAEGLWACSSEDPQNYLGFILGLSSDEGATFTPRLHFCSGQDAPGIRGQLACSFDSKTSEFCRWEQLRANLGCDGPSQRDAGAGDAGLNNDPVAAGGSGCDCASGSSATSILPWGGLLVMLLSVLRGIARRVRHKDC